MHVGGTPKLGFLLHLGAQTGGHVQQVGTCLAHRLQNSLLPAPALASSRQRREAFKVKAQKWTSEPLLDLPSTHIQHHPIHWELLEIPASFCLEW
jgi:hypothetical protein